MHLPAINHKHRKARQDRSAFAELIAEPASGAFSLPANATLFFRSVDGCAAGTTAATLAGAFHNPDTGEAEDRVIKTPELEAGGRVAVGRVERAVEVTPEAGFEVLIDLGLGRTAKVGEGA